MSSSLLYHAFGVRGYDYETTYYVEGKVVFWIRQKLQRLCCSACGSKQVIRRGEEPRRFRSLPIGGRPVGIILPIPRVQCRQCGVVRRVTVPFARGRCSYTKSLERYVIELCRLMTIQDVARHLEVGWDLVKEIHARDLGRRLGQPKLKHLKQIAIDEISIGKGQRYLTVVLDLQSGRVVYVGDGKGADALKPFWKRLRASPARVQAVAMDMSLAYAAAVRDYLPQAVIVFDRFHIVKLFNQKLSDLRRELYGELTNTMHRQVLQGTRWLLLKNPEHWDTERRERERLQEALQLNEPLATAYYMKEDLRQIWDQPDKATAWRVLRDWNARAQSSGIRLLQKFAHTLTIYRNGILAYYDFPITTGPLEGTNNKIQLMKRKS